MASAAPIVIRIKLRYDDVEVMVQRFATNVGKSGLFLPTKSVQPIGAEIKFDLRLSDDTPVLVGLGRVKAATPPDPNNPKATFGMAIELMRVTPQSRALILRMLEQRRAMGLPELGLPRATDIDAARRADAVNAPARDSVSGLLPTPPAPPAPAAPSEVPPQPPLSGEALLTAPRRTTGPMAVAKVLAVTPLAPEPPRRKRMALPDLLESAARAVASMATAVPGLDDEVDLAAAIVRARVLAGDTLDADLEALFEGAAVPQEISIEEASAELARQFGGHAILRDRSARWAPPPATAIPPAPVPSPPATGAEPPQPHDQEPSQVDAHTPLALPLAPEESAAPPEATVAPDEPEATADHAGTPGPDNEAGQDLAGSLATPDVAPILAEPGPHAPLPSPGDDPPPTSTPTPQVHEFDPAQIAHQIHPLNELDLDDVEHTELGEIPSLPGAFAADGDRSELPDVDQMLLAARLEAQLAEAEAEAEADDLGLASTAGMTADHDAVAYDPADQAPDPHANEAPPPPPDPGTEEEEEIDDFEILAEADAEDADLLTANGEQEASNSHIMLDRPRPRERRPSEYNFAARLDFEEDGDRDFALSPNEFAAHHAHGAGPPRFVDRHAHDDLHDFFDDEPRLPSVQLDSVGPALAAFDLGNEPSDQADDEAFDEADGDEPKRGLQPTFDPELSSSFTLAGTLTESEDLDLPPPFRSEPAGANWPPRNPLAVLHPEPGRQRQPLPPALHHAPMEDHELEHALEALDADLEDLSISQVAPQLPYPPDPTTSGPTQMLRPVSQTPPRGRASVPTPSSAARQVSPAAPGSGRVPAPPARLPTDDDDEVVIEFDDDE